jgi:hypothetical protein
LFPNADKPIPDDDPVTDNLGDYYEEEYEVKKLVAHQYNLKGNLQYKVKWLNFPDDHISWQTLEDVTSAPDAIQDY